MSDFQIDWDRAGRTGVAEAVLCGHKSPALIAAILAEAAERRRRLLLTRLSQEQVLGLGAEMVDRLDYDVLSATAIFGDPAPLQESGIGIVAAGTSDLPVAREAARTLAFNGHDATIIADVGVAGLWRLMNRLDDIRSFRIVIAVAGMEGALFSVLAGLVAAPLIAVPTSVGYGVAAGGQVALNAALASCSPGVTVVNIDNGFGAAAAAMKMLSLASSGPLR